MIDGPIFFNDGVNITLTEDTDFTQSGTTFTIINDDYAWSNLTLNYDFLTDDITNIRTTNVVTNVSGGTLEFFSSIGTVFGILIAVVIILAIVLILLAIKGFGGDRGISGNDLVASNGASPRVGGNGGGGGGLFSRGGIRSQPETSSL